MMQLYYLEQSWPGGARAIVAAWSRYSARLTASMHESDTRWTYDDWEAWTRAATDDLPQAADTDWHIFPVTTYRIGAAPDDLEIPKVFMFLKGYRCTQPVSGKMTVSQEYFKYSDFPISHPPAISAGCAETAMPNSSDQGCHSSRHSESVSSTQVTASPTISQAAPSAQPMRESTSDNCLASYY